jgi:hypothetical protein
MEEAGNGLLPPGIILLGLQILLLLDLLATYLIPVPDVEEAGKASCLLGSFFLAFSSCCSLAS